MVEPLVLGRVAAGNTPETLVLGRVAAGKAPKMVVLGSVAQQQASNTAFAGQLANVAVAPVGTTGNGISLSGYIVIGVIILFVGYYLYNRRGGKRND